MSHYLSRVDSGTFDPVTKRYCRPQGINATGRRMLFTGPDGITNQRVNIEEDNRYVGIGTMSTEGTSELAYLYRPDWRNAPAVRPKHKRVGEIGWGIPKHSDRFVLLTGQQIKRGEFRQSAEDRHTHLYQNPWTPLSGSSSQRPRTAPVVSSHAVPVDQDYFLETSYEKREVSPTEENEIASHSGSSHSSYRR